MNAACCTTAAHKASGGRARRQTARRRAAEPTAAATHPDGVLLRAPSALAAPAVPVAAAAVFGQQVPGTASAPADAGTVPSTAGGAAAAAARGLRRLGAGGAAFIDALCCVPVLGGCSEGGRVWWVATPTASILLFGIRSAPQAGPHQLCLRHGSGLCSLGAMCQHGVQRCQICFPRASEKEKHHEHECGPARGAEDEADV